MEENMIDLHTHTLLSDGVLLPSEMVRRAKEKGYKAIALTDHIDKSNIEYVTKGLVKVSKDLNKKKDIKVIPGVEITHVPPEDIKELVKMSKDLGAKLVIIHGETIVEPVICGTNRAAILAGADILTHPGLITEEDVKLAKEKGVYLEISAKHGSSLTNGHIAKLGSEIGAKLVFSTDAHSPEDLASEELRYNILKGSGLEEKDIKEVIKNAEKIVDKMG